MHGYTILNGGDLDENGNSKEGKLVMRDQKNCTKTVLTKMAIKEGKPIMHGYITSHGTDLNENENFKMWKLIIQEYKHLHGSDLNENENYEEKKKETLFN